MIFKQLIKYSTTYLRMSFILSFIFHYYLSKFLSILHAKYQVLSIFLTVLSNSRSLLLTECWLLFIPIQLRSDTTLSPHFFPRPHLIMEIGEDMNKLSIQMNTRISEV